jgi:4-hydroxybenzoate polyprenyltransferase
MNAYLRRTYDVAMLSRPMNAVQPLFLVVIGAVLAGVMVSSDWRLPVALGVVLLVHGATTMWNDIEDVAIDKRNHVTTLLTQGFVSKKTVGWVIVGQLVCALVGLIFLPPMAWTGILLLLFLGWSYNVAPLRFSRRPIASMVVLAFSYGFLPLIVGASLGHVDGVIIFLALFWSLARVSLSILKDYKDAVGDAMSNKRTFLLVYGQSNVRFVSLLGAVVGNGGVLAILVAVLSRGESLWYGAAAGVAFLIIVGWRLRLFLPSSYKELNILFHQCLAIQLGVEGAVVLWLLTPYIS